MSNKMEKAYSLSKNFYDDLLTQSNFLGKLYGKLFWGGADDNFVANKILSYIPDDFTGTLLDVPVGTAVFTEAKWKNLKNANIICLDYSEDMLDKARQRLNTCKNVICVQGDVGNLPFEDNSCDIVFSMNGFHVFPDKNKAFSEVYRVLKPQGKFISTYYIAGENRLTDFLIKQILVRKGWLNPPFQTFSEVKEMLNSNYENIEIANDKTIIYFCCEKRSAIT